VSTSRLACFATGSSRSIPGARCSRCSRPTRLGPTVPQVKWLQEELAAATATERPPLVAGNILDLETVKEVVFRRLGLGARPDARALLAWAADDKAAGFLTRPAEMRQQVRKWIEDGAGTTGGLMLDSIEAGYAQIALPLGVVLRCVVTDCVGHGCGGAGCSGPARAIRGQAQREARAAGARGWRPPRNGCAR
jgi:hypothetical protein